MIEPGWRAVREVLSNISTEELTAIAENPGGKVALRALQNTGEWRDVRGFDGDDDEYGDELMVHTLRFRPEIGGVSDAFVQANPFVQEDLQLRLDESERIQQLAQEILQERRARE